MVATWSARSAGREFVLIRKFAVVAMVAAGLFPGLALAHEDPGLSRGSPETSSSETPSDENPDGTPETSIPANHRLPWAESAFTGQFSTNLAQIVAPTAYPSAGGQSELCQNTGTDALALNCANSSSQPTADFTFYFRPRWTFSDNFQIRGLLVGSVEMTDTAFTNTTYQHQFLFSDPVVDFMYTGLPTIGGFKINLALRTTFPLSLASQAQTRIMGLGAVVSIIRPIPHVLGGALTFAVIGAYLHPFYEYTTPGTDTVPYARQCGPGGDASCTGQGGSSYNVANSFSLIATAQLAWTHFNLNAIMWLTNSLTYGPSGIGATSAIADPSTIRDSSYFIFSGEYTPSDWMGIEVGYFMQRSFLMADGTIGNPIYDPYQDSRVYLGFNFTLDRMYEAITHTGSHTPATASIPSTSTHASIAQQYTAL